jgi:hypothetical protein
LKNVGPLVFLFLKTLKVFGFQIISLDRWRLFHKRVVRTKLLSTFFCVLGFGLRLLLCLTSLSKNISVISWLSVLLVEETRVLRPVASHWQTISHNVVSSTLHHEQDSNSLFCYITVRSSENIQLSISFIGACCIIDTTFIVRGISILM